MIMDGDEKSDEGIVPEKRPNKGRELPAEVVEGRTSPKGNGFRRPRSGHLAGLPRRLGWQPCAKRHDEVRMFGSPPCCITSPSIF